VNHCINVIQSVLYLSVLFMPVVDYKILLDELNSLVIIGCGLA